jgi:hypothetical protein
VKNKSGHIRKDALVYQVLTRTWVLTLQDILAKLVTIGEQAVNLEGCGQHVQDGFTGSCLHQR